MGQQHESNSAGLEKQSPLEIHRLSPQIGSAKSAYSVAESQALSSLQCLNKPRQKIKATLKQQFPIFENEVRQKMLAYRGVNPPDSLVETCTRIDFPIWHLLILQYFARKQRHETIGESQQRGGKQNSASSRWGSVETGQVHFSHGDITKNTF